MVRNPFAVRENKIILIQDLCNGEKGAKCNCFCPACNDGFIAKMGEERVHHFAHSAVGCDEAQAYLTGMYRLLKEMFEEGKSIYIPPLIIEICLQPNIAITIENIEQYTKLVPHLNNGKFQIKLNSGGFISFTNTQFSYDNKGNIIALIVSVKSNNMAIRIMPPDTVCKYSTISRFKNLSTLALNFKYDDEFIRNSDRIKLEEYISSKKMDSFWIINNLISKSYPEIVRRYEEYVTQCKISRKQKEDEENNREEEYATRLAQIEIENRFAQTQKRIQPMSAFSSRNEYHITIGSNVFGIEEKRRLGYEDVRDKFTQQDTIIRDQFNTRWVKCEICDEIKQDVDFTSYGGKGRKNLGNCSICGKHKNI